MSLDIEIAKDVKTIKALEKNRYKCYVKHNNNLMTQIYMSPYLLGTNENYDYLFVKIPECYHVHVEENFVKFLGVRIFDESIKRHYHFTQNAYFWKPFLEVYLARPKLFYMSINTDDSFDMTLWGYYDLIKHIDVYNSDVMDYILGDINEHQLQY